MALVTSVRRLRALHALRFVVLTTAAMLVGHTAVYVAAYGLGADLAGAMRAGGHDGYWTVFSVLVAGAALLFLLLALVRLAGLSRRLEAETPTGPVRGREVEPSVTDGLVSYRRELWSLATRLLPSS